MNNFLFFRYSPHETFIHQISPIVKIICVFVYTLLTFATFKTLFFTIIYAILNFIFILFLFYLSKINLLNIFRQLLNFKFLILFIFVINLLTIQKQAHVMRIFLIDKQFMPKAFFQTSKIIYRIFKMLSISNILIVTTRPQEIASSFCTLLRPLSFLKLQSENINMMITISIRYIYIFFQEINRLYKAQISRGMKNDNFFQKITIFFLIINPLFDFIFRSSNDLVFALKTRGYRINVNRTHYRQIILHKKDAITITFMAFFLLLFVIIRLLEY